MGKMTIGSIKQTANVAAEVIEKPVFVVEEREFFIDVPVYSIIEQAYQVEKPVYVTHDQVYPVKKPVYHEQVFEHIVKVPVVKHETEEIVVTKYSLTKGKDWILPVIMTVSAIAHIAALIWR